VLPQDRAHGQAEVADDPFLLGEDEGAGRVHLLRRESVASQPTVELIVAGVERREVVVGVESLESERADRLCTTSQKSR
jgi:hypothetical protein